MSETGDEVLLRGTVEMRGLGIEDEEVLIKLAGKGGFAVVREEDIVGSEAEAAMLYAQDKAVVSRADLHTGLLRVEQQLTLTHAERSAVTRLRAAAGNAPSDLPPARDISIGTFYVDLGEGRHAIVQAGSPEGAVRQAAIHHSDSGPYTGQAIVVPVAEGSAVRVVKPVRVEYETELLL